MEKFVYEGKIIKVSEEDIGGHIYERAYIGAGMTIIAVSDDHQLLFIKESRPHEVPSVRWKLVTGFYEDNQDLTENVNRELQEEIGKKARNVELYLKLSTSGTLMQTQYVVIARNLVDSKLPNPDGEGTILELKPLPLEEVFQRTLDGEFSRGFTGYALLRLFHDVERKKVVL